MDRMRFDQISKLFAERPLSRRTAVRTGATGFAAGLGAASLAATEAQEATPAPGEGEKVAYLFIQSFQAGALTPKVGEEGRFTLTLESGLGQTIYFSDRPLRDVGATPTPQFLENLGFPADNPPNAALLVEDGGNVNSPSSSCSTHATTRPPEPLPTMRSRWPTSSGQPTADSAKRRPT